MSPRGRHSSTSIQFPYQLIFNLKQSMVVKRTMDRNKPIGAVPTTAMLFSKYKKGLLGSRWG
jgi:hypothetical protein